MVCWYGQNWRKTSIFICTFISNHHRYGIWILCGIYRVLLRGKLNVRCKTIRYCLEFLEDELIKCRIYFWTYIHFSLATKWHGFERHNGSGSLSIYDCVCVCVCAYDANHMSWVWMFNTMPLCLIKFQFSFYLFDLSQNLWLFHLFFSI